MSREQCGARLRSASRAVALGFAVAAVVLGAQRVAMPEAQACGGCFVQPPTTPEAVSSVTDHRMVFAVSPRQTTLWDQFTYVGRPEDFVWVLPVANAANIRIGLGDQAFMDALDEQSAPTVEGRFAPCIPVAPPPRPASGGCGANLGPTMASPEPSTRPAMESTRIGADGMAVVGPYAITVLGAHLGGSVERWLAERGFLTPPDTRAAIAHYDALEFDYVIVRLRPGAGVQQMQPVRVTTRGYSPVLPLRMVAAGVGDQVGLTLMVLAASRMEAQNFRNAEVDDDDLTFDANTMRSNWREVYRRAVGRVPGRTWVTESVADLELAALFYEEARHATMPPITMGDDAAALGDGALLDALGLDDAALGLEGDAGAWTAPCIHTALPPPSSRGGCRRDAGPTRERLDAATSDGASDAAGGMFELEGGAVSTSEAGTTMEAPDGGWSEPVAYVDRTYAFAGLGERAVLTRLRTDLRPTELSTDLVLDASVRGLRSKRYVGVVLNGPTCPPPRNACSVAGVTAPVALGAAAVVLAAVQWRRRARRRHAARPRAT